MIKHIENKKKEKYRKLIFTGPFTLFEISFFIILLLPEINPATSKTLSSIIHLGTIPSLICVIPFIIFLNNSTELYYLTKFELEIERKYPDGLSYQKFLEESELVFPRYKIYLYNNDLFMMGRQYHIISLDIIKKISFKPILFRFHHRWFLVLTTVKGTKELEIFNSIDITPERVNSELVEPIKSLISNKYREIEFKGITDI